jgi:adenine deaminase
MHLHPTAAVLVILVAGTVATSSDGPRLEAVVRDITVFDARSGDLRSHQDILIGNTRVLGVRPHDPSPVDAKYALDGAGKFAVPGLFEHATPGTPLADTRGAVLARGVTSIWASGWATTEAARWQRGLDRGEFYGPRLVGLDPPANATPGMEGARRRDSNVLDTLVRLTEVEGMTAARALQEMTLGAAGRAGRGADLGSIDAGKIADVLVLSKDPLVDIRNVRAIDAVIFRGEVLTQAHLNLLRQGRLKPGDGQLRRGQR